MIEFNELTMKKGVLNTSFVMSDDEHCIASESDGFVSDEAIETYVGEDVFVINGIACEYGKFIFCYFPRLGYAAEVLASYVDVKE